jgi:hypothetical protein
VIHLIAAWHAGISRIGTECSVCSHVEDLLLHTRRSQPTPRQLYETRIHLTFYLSPRKLCLHRCNTYLQSFLRGIHGSGGRHLFLPHHRWSAKPTQIAQINANCHLASIQIYVGHVSFLVQHEIECVHVFIIRFISSAALITAGISCNAGLSTSVTAAEVLSSSAISSP